MQTLLEQCEEYLVSLGFVKDEQWCRAEITEKELIDRNSKFRHLTIRLVSGKLKTDYMVCLQKVDFGAEAFEIEGSVVVRISRTPHLELNEKYNEDEECIEILGITITGVSELKLLVEGTRSWRFMHLP